VIVTPSGRVVIFTAVSELHFRKIASTLVDSGDVPSWFLDLEYIKWNGEYKDISFIPNLGSKQVILIDDRKEYIKPGQEDSWIYIPEYAPPYSQDDYELDKIIKKLASIN
jgi:hypothetical protein